MPDPTQRFSDRVADYVRYRPTYPRAVLDLLLRECGIGPDVPVADLGAGTGILTALLLDAGGRVFAVEPNAEMRAAAEEMLGSNPRFVSVDGTAERTGLPEASVGLVTAGQAFHWFDAGAARVEALRILRPGGFAALIWNSRQLATSAFLADYEALLQRWGTDYREVAQQYADPAALGHFFGATPWRRFVTPNVQLFDLAGLEGRLRSSSYTPPSTDARFAPMMEELRALFARHAEDGRVAFRYDTEVFYGAMGAG
jgi:SAM-dependent methyltransferase